LWTQTAPAADILCTCKNATSDTWDCAASDPVFWMDAATCYVGASELVWDESATLPAPNTECLGGTNVSRGAAAFGDSADTGMCRQIKMPVGSTALNLSLHWATVATSGNVIWAAQTICVADSEAIDPALNTATTATVAADATSLDANVSAIASVDVTGCAAGELMTVCVSRDADNASDTLVGDALLIGVELNF
jgi:hypothetical protein